MDEEYAFEPIPGPHRGRPQHRGHERYRGHGGNRGHNGNRGRGGDRGHGENRGHNGNRGHGGDRGHGENIGHNGNRGHGGNRHLGGNRGNSENRDMNVVRGYGGNRGRGGNRGQRHQSLSVRNTQRADNDGLLYRVGSSQSIMIPTAPMRGNINAQQPHNRPNNMNDRGRAQISSDHPRKPRTMGFLTLQTLVKSESNDIISEINMKKDAFLHLLNSPIERPDVHVLVIELLAKISLSSFDQLKLIFLLDACNSAYISSLRNYLVDLPYPEAKKNNNMYWNNQSQFWENLLIFCEGIINFSPSTALKKCKSLIERTTKLCLDDLNQRHGFELSEECSLKLKKLRDALTQQETQKTEEQTQGKFKLMNEDEEPPENFRQLNVVPRRSDLLEDRPFLRANVVKGGYRDVEHYLDVQFRLLREDCFGPLREGILQFIRDPTKKRFDHIRVFRNVKFVEPYVSKQKIGLVVELDAKTKQRFKKINWNHNRRFIFGSLLVFTKDNCNTIIVATILERDAKYLEQGMIPVSLVDEESGNNLCKQENYTMIESEVYFEPYYHVLRALQDPAFSNHIPMKQYIIEVNPESKPAVYINENTTITVEIDFSLKKKFNLLDFNTWPSCDEINLNESQYEAYRLALTHEFAVIQGPPGTGKTFLGVKVAKTLIENIRISSGCLLLLVCFTNHALDQFLEAILPITDSIVRIGGQSRNEAMQKINLNNLRKNAPRVSHSRHKLYFEQRQKLKECISKIQKATECVESLNSSILSYSCINKVVPETNVIGEFYQRSQGYFKDPLYSWLFEDITYDFSEPIDFEEIENSQTNKVADDDDINENRNDLVLDDIDTDNLGSSFDMNIQTTFSIRAATEQIKYLTARYKNSNSSQEKRDLYREIIVTRTLMRVFNEMRSYHDQGVEVGNPDALRTPTRMAYVDRWMLYFKWTKYVARDLKEKIMPLQEDLRTANTEYEESRMIVDYELLKNYQVIGMTTSGAARLRKLLQALAPPIVIVEEAAEVLEQHIVTSLTNKCRHLILIGDHQQLRPSAAHMRLARHYNIEVSLFERMIMNDMHSRRLTVQHRMRPQISALITPSIYPDLQNHPSVQDFPNVRGVTANVFFLSHNYKEEIAEDSSSKTNMREGDLVLGLANYIMQQDYEPEDVTILAAYSGQMFYMRKQRQLYSHLSKVKITVVDNYQGEESKIILLSLVRNNDENKIGFLATENRVCVALSRAKEGFYMFGNIDILKNNSPLWTKVASTLEGFGSLGTSIRLMCERHDSQISVISCPEDFGTKVPEGGCLLKCNYNLPCLHACPLMCHGYDRGHKLTKCRLKCERIICDLQHVCPLMCAQMCQPCIRSVSKKLPCGHMKTVFCHQDPKDPEVKCMTLVPVQLPTCGHKVKKSCYMETALVKCPVPCEYRVDKCGHVCTRSCHVGDDPDHERYLCQKPCAKAKKGCSMVFEGDRGDHQCLKRCHEACEDCNVEVMKKRESCKHKERVACSGNPDAKPCRKNCARVLSCGHFCRKKCFEDCGTDCKQIVTKTIPECNHQILIECGSAALQRLCKKACERILPCGHRCPGRCSDPCDSEKCKELAPQSIDSPCGHKVQLSCYIYKKAIELGTVQSQVLLKHCKHPCGAELACNDICTGTCASCKQGRLHMPCSKTCHQINICGHQCTEPCNQVCPPCTKPCEVKCQHSRCSRVCGAVCTPCKEVCTRECVHRKCGRSCGQVCAHEPCPLRCSLILACKHQCRGLCGEPCPDVCKLCRPEDFPKDFLGDDFDDDALFIKLEDCGHIMEFENMENLMKGDSNLVSIRACPFCRKPIINTPRYKDLVNRMFETDINPIKNRVYGNERTIIARRDELVKTVAEFSTTHRIYNDILYSDWKKAFDQMVLIVRAKEKCSLLQLDMYFVYLNILQLLSEIHEKYTADKLNALQENIVKQISMICKVLISNVHKISQQQQADIGNEIKRTNAMVHLSKIMSHSAYIANKNVKKVMEAVEVAKKAILGWSIYDKNKAVVALKELQDAIKVSGIVTREERQLIIRAIGAKAGQWYKCPNGHFYSIDRCGGAMEVGICVECKTEIGGTDHRLLDTNRHAGEFDNSRYPAYSEQANLANFDLNNIL